jgi:Heparinase II/III-like protein
MNKYLVRNVLLFALTFLSLASNAYDPRDLLQKMASIEQLKSYLVPGRQWIKYPAYTDRSGWNVLAGGNKIELIKGGEKYLDYEWRVVKATDYIEYEKSGSRVAMEIPFNSNNTALSQLMIAEMTEGKGRFMNQIINGVWQLCDMPSWALSAHLGLQKSKRSLPDFNEHIIDLTSGDMGAFLSWTYYLLHHEFDKVNPIIAQRLRKNLQDRILDPYMARSDYWWQAFNYKPGTMVNNWNPWCNFDVLTCFLLLEEDPNKLATAVHKTMESVDKFINYTHEDGACEEGPSYWGHAAGKMYDYLQLLSYATNDKVSIFNEPIIKNMGEYIARSYVGNGWVVNFADASAKGGGDPGLIYRYGKAVGSKDMQGFASYLLKQQQGNIEINAGRDYFRTMENLTCLNALQQTPPALTNADYSWYPQTEFCYMKNSTGFFFAAKGGYNAESHNHNDAGTFSLYLDGTPIFIDAGVGTYTRQTFSSERYTIWTMQSNYHNLPMINGEPQQFGAAYKAKQVKFDAGKKSFSMDISGAYHQNAGVEKWQRTYQLAPSGGLTINDQFKLSKTNKANQVNFMTWGKPDLSKDGEVLIEKEGKRVKLLYDKNLFSAVTEVIPQTDARLSKVWGTELYRVSLNANKMQLTGKYTFSIMNY